jgi:hypothetical protein
VNAGNLIRPDFQTTGASWWWLCPELPIAGVVVFAAPIWSIVLLMEGRYAKAAMLLAGAAAGGYGLYWTLKDDQKWPAYFIAIAILGVALLASN